MEKKLNYGTIRFSGSLPLLKPIFPILNSGCKIWDISGSMISHLETVVGFGRNGKYVPRNMQAQEIKPLNLACCEISCMLPKIGPSTW